MIELIPYLTFNGNCEEAMNFYRDCLEGEILSTQYFDKAPMDISEDLKKKIMHMALKIGKSTLMASDSMPEHQTNVGNNISLSIGIDELAKAENYFQKLSEGGKITMPLQDTFWGARFGMLKDKFDINWMINCELKK